jgi:uncharacterized protein YggE
MMSTRDSLRPSRANTAPVLGVFVTLLAAVLVITGCAPKALAAPVTAAGDTTSPRTITVVGRGEVKAKPDIATVNLGVEVTAPTVSEAMTEANARMKTILAAMKALGIADKDIQTSNFSINFERQTPTAPAASEPTTGVKGGGAQAANGFYRVNNMIQVTIHDLDKVGDVLDAAVEAGANNVWGVTFGLDNTDALEAQARAKAVDDARSRAESLAKLNGVTLGDVISVSEVIGGGPSPIYPQAAAIQGLGGGGAPVEPGELTFSTQIQTVYGIH